MLMIAYRCLENQGVAIGFMAPPIAEGAIRKLAGKERRMSGLDDKGLCWNERSRFSSYCKDAFPLDCSLRVRHRWKLLLVFVRLSVMPCKICSGSNSFSSFLL
ncbi:hypothetical protein AVEN_142142-1 [Araneus ventricosus]|uniref:Uncharacterized protein n=1 Tax=Araneus ventricosus TaxID=182803 RepID=A0A4Y2DH01_ARAVE|nr:hypothetical protein AVEN_142142-1 [Araneus ventricosus]